MLTVKFTTWVAKKEKLVLLLRTVEGGNLPPQLDADRSPPFSQAQSPSSQLHSVISPVQFVTLPKFGTPAMSSNLKPNYNNYSCQDTTRAIEQTASAIFVFVTTIVSTKN